MKIYCLKSNNVSFNGRFTNVLSKIKSIFIPRQRASAMSSRVMGEGVVDTFVRRELGVTQTIKVLSNGQAMKIVEYPKCWPNSDIVFSKSMSSQIDKNMTGFRMTIPDYYLKKHPEVASEEGAIEFAKIVRQKVNEVHSEDKIKKRKALEFFAELLGAEKRT